MELSPKTSQLVKQLFSETERPDVADLLITECGNNLPFMEEYDAYQLERVRFAVLKLSEGDIDKLLSAVQLAQIDARDVYMVAGFGYSVTEHQEWARLTIDS
jgi:hypothetical protein